MPPTYVINAYEETINAYAEEVSKGIIGGYKFLGSKLLRAKEFIQKQSILKVARDNEFVTPCTAGTLSYVIMEDGSIKPCEILFDKIGNVYDKDKSFFDEFEIVFNLRNVSLSEIADVTSKEFFSNISLISIYLIFFKVFKFQF